MLTIELNDLAFPSIPVQVESEGIEIIRLVSPKVAQHAHRLRQDQVVHLKMPELSFHNAKRALERRRPFDSGFA